MSTKVDEAQAVILLLAAAGALYVGYQVYKTSGRVANAVGGALDDAAEGVTNVVTSVKRGAQNAYAEVASIVTGQVHYSPEALDGSMSRADAMRLADDIAKRDAELDAEQYQLMVDNENERLLKRYPAGYSPEPSFNGMWR